VTIETSVEEDPAGRVRVMERRRLGTLVLSERRVERPEPALIEAALLQRLRRDGLGGLPMEEAAPLRARVAFLRALEGEAWPDLSDAGLTARLDEWAPPLVGGLRSLSDVNGGRVHDAVAALIPWEQRRRLDVLAPERLTTPAGATAAIDYAAEGGPRAEVRVQALFGLDRHPAIADGRVPLTLALLSPAGRPIALTADLPGFWRGGWADVRRELRGRYPKHPWPEDPLTAPPTTRARPRGT
jgi:ATP-dependent helicase HrpB